MVGDTLGQAAGFAWRGARLVAGMFLGRPVQCLLQVTERCDLRCGFCGFWRDAVDPRDEMTAADVGRMSDRLARVGSLIISIEGGEPLLRSDLADLISILARRHHPILFTNGLHVTDGRARELWRAGLGSVGVSIDYSTGSRHDAHRGAEGVFERALRAVAVLRDAAPRGGRQVAIISVVMDDNVDELEGLLHLSRRLGVRHEVTLLSTARGSERTGRLPPVGTGARLLGLQRRHPHLVTLPGYLAGIDRFLDGKLAAGCHAGRRMINIDSRGNVSPCIERRHVQAGNILRDPWPVIAGRLDATGGAQGCAACYTECRGFVDQMTGRPKLRAWRGFLGGLANPAIPR